MNQKNESNNTIAHPKNNIAPPKGINDVRALSSKIFFTYMFNEKKLMPKQNKIEADEKETRKKKVKT